MQYYPKFILFAVSILFLVFSSCRKERFTTDTGDRLEFSVDTLRFDTVFTNRGSATRSIKVFNRHNRSIRIDKIELSANSFYRMNVDGTPTSLAEEIEIAPKDSMYIFTEVEIDPTNAGNPFVILDSIEFQTNGNTQHVFLESFGQDANYVGDSYRIGLLSCGGGTIVWDDVKPYVVLGFLLVDSCHVVINAGVDVHFQGGTSRDTLDDGILLLPNGTFYFSSEASLEVNGQLGNPVRFLTDRIEPEFEEIPGQWGGIFLSPASTGNSMNYAEIRNAGVGIRVDSAADLTINNSIIYDSASSGLLGIHSTITGQNCLIFDVSTHNLQIEHGGDYHFTHCTFANEANNVYLSHSDPVLRMSNYFVPGVDDEGVAIILENDLNARFENCIFYGTRPDELLLDNPEIVSADYNFIFDHCLIKADTLNTAVPGFMEPVLVSSSEDFGFLDSDELDYRLDTIINPAVNAGSDALMMPVPIDLDGMARDASPDIGCYEFFD